MLYEGAPVVEDMVLEHIGVNGDDVGPDARPVSERELDDLPPKLRNAGGVHETPRLPNGPRLSCGALKNDAFLNLRAPTASSAC